MTLGLVVVGVDRSEASDRALEWAGRLAAGTGTELVVVHGWSQPEIEGEGELIVRDSARYLREHNIAYRTVIEMTDPRELLIAVGEREGADLIVIGTRGHNLLIEVALGSVGEYLIHHSPCPVTVVPSAKGVATGTRDS